jgi:hypothetical protein
MTVDLIIDDFSNWYVIDILEEPDQTEIDSPCILDGNIKDILPESVMLTMDKSDLSMLDEDCGKQLTMINHHNLKSDFNKENHFCVVCNIDSIIEQTVNPYYKFDTQIMSFIEEQFLLDFERMTVMINSVQINNVDDFIEIVNIYKWYDHDLLGDFYNLSLMITNQSSFYTAFSIINDLFTNPDTNIYTLQDNDCPKINVLLSRNKIEFVFQKIIRVVNVDSGEILHRFLTSTVMEFRLEMDKFPTIVNDSLKIYCLKLRKN